MKKNLIVLLVLLLLGLSASGCSDDTESDGNDVDVDLTGLSQTIVEAQFQNIITNSADFLGKTIRVIGTYYPLHIAELNETYHYVIIVFGDECCQMGFEFKRDGNYMVPDDYPAMNELIEVIGVLSRYEEWGSTFLYLAVKELIPLNN
jgi:hypothetical protein